VNVFNRIAMSLILLLFIACALVFSLLPGTAVQFVRSALDTVQGSLGSPMQFLGAVIGLLLAVGAFLLLVAELRPRKRQSVVVAQGTSGTAELTTESIALRVRRTVEGISSVGDVSPAIRSRGKAVDVLLRVSADPDVDLPQKTEEIMQAVRAEVEGKMGIPIKALKVTVKHSGNGRRFTPQGAGGGPKDPFRA